MAIAGFKTAVSAIKLNTGGFTLTGDNAGFCSAIMQKAAGGVPMRLESLTYILPADEQPDGGQPQQPPIIVNLLMQLRAYCDQNNAFISNHTALQAQITAQLHQTLIHSNAQVRQKTAEIERALKRGLYQNRDFKRAVASLEREVKKNSAKEQGFAYPVYLNNTASAALLPPHKADGEKKMGRPITRRIPRDAIEDSRAFQPQSGRGRFEAPVPHPESHPAGIMANATGRYISALPFEPKSGQMDLIYSDINSPEHKGKMGRPLKQVSETDLPKLEDGQPKKRVQDTSAPAEQLEIITRRGNTGQNGAGPPQMPESRMGSASGKGSNAAGHIESGASIPLLSRLDRHFAFLSHAGRLPPPTDIHFDAYYDRYEGRASHFINSEDIVRRYFSRLMAGEKWAASSRWREPAAPKGVRMVYLSLLEGGDAPPSMGAVLIKPEAAAMSAPGRMGQGVKNSFTAVPEASAGGRGLNSGDGLFKTGEFDILARRKESDVDKSAAGMEAKGAIIHRAVKHIAGMELPPDGKPSPEQLPPGKLAESFLSEIVSRHVTAVDSAVRQNRRINMEPFVLGDTKARLKQAGERKSAAGMEAGGAILHLAVTDITEMKLPPDGKPSPEQLPPGKLAESLLSETVDRRITAADIAAHQPQRRYGTARRMERIYDALFGATAVPDNPLGRGSATVHRRPFYMAADAFRGGSVITAAAGTAGALSSGGMEIFPFAAGGFPFAARPELMKSTLVGMPPESDAPLHHISAAPFPGFTDNGGAQSKRIYLGSENIPPRNVTGLFSAGRAAPSHPLQRMARSYTFSRAKRLGMTRFYSMISNRRKEQRRERPQAGPPKETLQYFSEPLNSAEYLLPQGRVAVETPKGAAARTPTPALGTAGGIVYRMPAPESRPPSYPQKTEADGEDVLRMQTVSSGAAKELNAAYSFDAAGPRQPASEAAREITREQEERILQRIISDVNYNRMADELLIRIERRLRAERRKFGK